MADIKSHEFDAYLQRPLKDRLYLIYGPDRGLVSERAAQIAAKTGIALDDPFSLIKLDAADLQQDAGRMLDEVNGIGLFGGEKLVWVRATGTEKALIEGLSLLSREPPEAGYVIIEAGDLKKGTGLRKVAEAAREIISVACYGDDVRAVNALIDQELALENLRITQAARLRLNDALGGDRMASRNEIRKLALYCRGAAVIEEEQVMEIVGDASAISVDDCIDAMLKGDANALDRAIRKITASRTPIFLVLQASLKLFQLLDLMRAEMDEKRQPPAQVVAALGRHLHFRRKPLVETALKTWNAAAIRRELGRLQAAIFQSRARQSLDDTIAMQSLLAVTLQSARR